MNEQLSIDQALCLLADASSACKPLLWLRDTDSCIPLALGLLAPLRNALHTIVDWPNAVNALCDKMISIYDRAVQKPWVGIGAQPRSSRLGRRTAQIGLIRACEHAIAKQAEFQDSANFVRSAWATGSKDWGALFSLTEQLIDDLDWGEFVTENARGQASNLVLESVELLQAIAQHKGDEAIREETGDVFYNLMACCLSLRIGSEHIR